MKNNTASFHLPGLFEFYDFYKEFLPLYREHREYFYDFVKIGSIYGAPSDCLWGGGRVGFGDDNAEDIRNLLIEYGISARLTFSNSLLREEHLSDVKCNRLLECFGGESLSRACESFSRAYTKRKVSEDSKNTDSAALKNGIIIYSDLLLDYIKEKYPEFYFVSSTTKVITDFDEFIEELEREDFKYVVPDFRLNKRFDELSKIDESLKGKVEFLCNECCDFSCADRKACYENVSRKCLLENCGDHVCKSGGAESGYVFSKAMKNPSFIGINDIVNTYLPMGFSEFKIEGRSLGSAILLEFILYYMTKPEYQLNVREHIYLDSSLDLF